MTEQKPKTYGNGGWCDPQCPYLVSDQYYCSLVNVTIDYYDWFLAVCGDNDDTTHSRHPHPSQT